MRRRPEVPEFLGEGGQMARRILDLGKLIGTVPNERTSLPASVESENAAHAIPPPRFRLIPK